MNMTYIIGSILLQVIGYIILISVIIKQRSIKKGLKAYNEYQEYTKGGNDMKRGELLANLVSMGINPETAKKMIDVTDAVIEVKEVYNGIDREQLYQAGKLLKLRKTGVDVYYQFDEQVK